MNCNRVRKLIDDFHYGELTEPRASQVAAHLRECPDCSKELAVLESEDRIYQAYARKVENSIEIPASLWEHALLQRDEALARLRKDGERPARRKWRLGAILPASAWARQALAAAALVFLSVTCTLLLVRHYRAGEMAPARQVYEAGSTGTSIEAALQSVQRAEQEYLNAIKMLSDIIEKQKPTLDPGLVAELQENLKMIDQHIAATRKAYYEHPTNAELALYMLAAYSRKVELLQDLAS